jgi:hypothetical protein
VLRIKPSDVTFMGHIKIKSLKGSNDRIVLPLFFRSFWATAGSGLLPLSNYYSRFYFYRLFKKLGYYSKFGDNKVNSVTHFFRHQLILNLKQQNVPDDVISHFISHRNLKNLDYYAGKNKGKH